MCNEYLDKIREIRDNLLNQFSRCNRALCSFKFKLVLLFVITGCLSLSFALKSDDQQDMNLEAGSGTFDYKNRVTVFSGGVVITRGSLVVHADKGVATEDKDGNREVILYGTPVTFTQLLDDGDRINGQGNQFNYNTKTHLAVLTGRARVSKGKNVVIGDKITYNTTTQVYSASATPANGVSKQTSGRITVILDQGITKNNK